MEHTLDTFAAQLTELQRERAEVLSEREKSETAGILTEELELEFESALESISDRIFAMTEKLAEIPADQLSDMRTKAMFVAEYSESSATSDIVARLVASLSRDLLEQHRTPPSEEKRGDQRAG